MEKLINTLEWVRLEEFVPSSWCGEGRPPHERSWLANAFIAKVVLGIDTTVGLIERLQVDRRLRRLCGFMRWQRLPSESTFSRAFAEFSASRLGERVHEVLVKNTLGDRLISHLSRDSTAIESWERPVKAEKPEKAPVKAPKHRGRPRRDEVREPAKESKVQKQRRQILPEMLADIPKGCDRGTKQNAKGYKTSWNGYKLHIDTADCGVPVSVLLSSASMHDSLAAIPLLLISASRVTNCYDLMDAAYCCADLREHSRELGHVPLIDHIMDEYEIDGLRWHGVSYSDYDTLSIHREEDVIIEIRHSYSEDDFLWDWSKKLSDGVYARHSSREVGVLEACAAALDYSPRVLQMTYLGENTSW